jgi:hypothetical protein
MVFAEPAPRRVTLGRGDVASVGVAWNDNPNPHQSCPSTQWINVVLTQSVNHLNYEPPTNATPCGNNIWVTPIEAGASPKTNYS